MDQVRAEQGYSWADWPSMGVNRCKSLRNLDEEQWGKRNRNSSMCLTICPTSSTLNTPQTSILATDIKTSKMMRSADEYWRTCVAHDTTCGVTVKVPKQWTCHSWITEPHYIIHTSNDTSPQCCGTELTQLTCCQRMKVINPSESKCIIKMQILRARYNSKWIISNYLS